MIILDTNVVSELMSTQPDARVASWVRTVDDDLAITTVSVAEVGYGIQRMPIGRRRSRLEREAERLFTLFEDAIFTFDVPAAQHYGQLAAHREDQGRPISTSDAQIAAICRVQDAACATRNTADFELTGVLLINPWAN